MRALYFSTLSSHIRPLDRPIPSFLLGPKSRIDTHNDQHPTPTIVDGLSATPRLRH